MPILRTLLARLRALRRSAHADRDLDDELRAYVDARAASYERQGLAPAEAKRAALIEVEGVEHVKERVRDVRLGSAVEAGARDARYAARVLWRSPGYTLVVIMTLALGIGPNAAIFSVVYAVLWRSLPYPDAARIVVVEADTRGLPTAYSSSGAVFDVRTQSRLIAGIAQVTGRDASLEVDGVMERVAAARVTDGLLPLLGATPLTHGRTLIAAEDGHNVVVKGVVISHELWQRRLAGDPQVIGRRLTVNNFEVQVVGVMRPDFRLVLPTHVEERIDVWLPRELGPDLLYRGVPLVGRLAPGASVTEAQAELTALASSFVASHPSAYPGGLRLTVRPLGEVVTRDVKPALMALGAAVGFVLLIACVNVANLLLARAKTRERELAIRRALGATRFRLMAAVARREFDARHPRWCVRPLAGAAGCRCAGLAAAGPSSAPIRDRHRRGRHAVDRGVDRGLERPLRPGAGARLHEPRAWSAASREPRGIGHATQPSPAPRPRLVRDRALDRSAHRGRPDAADLCQSCRDADRIRSGTRRHREDFAEPLGIPDRGSPVGVLSRRDRARAGSARCRGSQRRRATPLAPVQGTLRFWRSDDGEATSSIGMHRSIMPGYLGVMGIPLRAGGDVSDDDIIHRRRVTVVDERLAAQLWQGDAIGKRLAVQYSKEPLEVVGVAGAIRARDIRDSGTLMIYVPSHVYEIEQTLVVKTRAPVSTIGPAIKQAVESLGPGRPVFDIRPMNDIVQASINNTRFTMLALSGFAIASLVLAGIGLYGTLAYLTSQRTQEFGVRLALGASAASILRLVFREGCLLTGLGAALGLAGATAAARVLKGMLYGVTPLDGLTMASVVALVAVVASVAVGWPAWRAARVDPTTALRAE